MSLIVVPNTRFLELFPPLLYINDGYGLVLFLAPGTKPQSEVEKTKNKKTKTNKWGTNYGVWFLRTSEAFAPVSGWIPLCILCMIYGQ